MPTTEFLPGLVEEDEEVDVSCFNNPRKETHVLDCRDCRTALIELHRLAANVKVAVTCPDCGHITRVTSTT